MIRTLLSCILSAGCLLLSTIANAAPRSFNISSVECINEAIKELSPNRDRSGTFILEGNVTFENINDLMEQSLFNEYTTSWKWVGSSGTSNILHFNVKWEEWVELYNALKNPKLAKRLNRKKQPALEQLRHQLKKYDSTKTSRFEKVMFLSDEFARKYYRPLRGTRKVSNVSHYMCLMTALDIPCRIVADKRGNRFWNMIQLENRAWYHVNLPEEKAPVFLTSTELKNLAIGKNKYTWDEERHPETPAKSNFNLPVFQSVDAFWKAAEDAYKKDEKAIIGFIKNYPGRQAFNEAYDQYIVKGGTVATTTIYAQQSACNQGYVRVLSVDEEDATAPAADDATESESPDFSDEQERPAKSRKKRRRRS